VLFLQYTVHTVYLIRYKVRTVYLIRYKVRTVYLIRHTVRYAVFLERHMKCIVMYEWSHFVPSALPDVRFTVEKRRQDVLKDLSLR